MKAFLVFTLSETSFATTSYSWIFLVWSVNYANLVYKLTHFGNVKMHKHCLYWKVFSSDIYRKIYFNSSFFSYICWSVNCLSWVSKFNNFFLTCTDTEARFIFEGFNIVLYGKFLIPRYIFFFIWSINCIRNFSLTLPVSKLYELSLWIMEHTSEMLRNVSINLYLRPCGIAIYGQFYMYSLYRLRLFWSVNCENLVCKLCITFWKCQDTNIVYIGMYLVLT